MIIRPYSPTDYEQVVALYRQSELYGGQFDNSRDSAERLKNRITNDPDAIFLAKK